MAGEKILIVEDDADLSMLLGMRLKKAGYSVISAGDGQEGLSQYKEEKPDLIVLDIMLPKLNGYEVCREIRRKHNDENIPIIMLTAKVDDFDRIKGRVIGANKYMTKPFRGEDLLAEIVKQLEIKRKRC